MNPLPPGLVTFVYVVGVFRLPAFRSLKDRDVRNYPPYVVDLFQCHEVELHEASVGPVISEQRAR